MPKAPREVGCPPAEGHGEGLDPSPENFLLFDLKMERFGAVFLKLDLTEENFVKTQNLSIATGGSCLLLPHTGYAYGADEQNEMFCFVVQCHGSTHAKL